MRILFYELRKIFKLRAFLPALAVVITLNTMLPGGLSWFPYIKKAYNAQQYAEQIEVHSRRYDIASYDLLLQEYGSSLTLADIPKLEKARDDYIALLDAAIKENEICKQYSVTNYHDLVIEHTWYQQYESEYYEKNNGQLSRQLRSDAVSDFFESIYWGGSSLDYKGGSLYLCFPKNCNEIIERMQIGNQFDKHYAAESEKSIHQADFRFAVLHPEILVKLGESMLNMQLCSLIFALLLLFPYLLSENRSNTYALQYSSKLGRKGARYKVLALSISALCVLLLGAAIAILSFHWLGLSRYYDSFINNVIYETSFTPWNILMPRSLANIRLGTLLWLVPALFVPTGLTICLCSNALSGTLRKPLAAFAATLPALGIGILLTIRYILHPLSTMYLSSPPFLFREEALIATTLLALAAGVAVFLQLRREKRRDV